MQELVTRDGEPVPKGRISNALKSAIMLIATQGLTVAEAAAATGYKTHSLTQALKKPHVRAWRASVKRAWLAGETEAAYSELCKLARSAGSEDVRLKAIRTLIDLDQAASRALPSEAKQLVQINVHHHAGLPGEQTSGVIEAPAYQVVSPKPSDSKRVGHPDSGDDDDV